MEFSEEFKAAVYEEAERQGKDFMPEEIGDILDLLTGDVCAEYMNEVKRNVAVELDKVRMTEAQVQRKQEELNTRYEEVNRALAEYKTAKDEAGETWRCLPREMMAVSNLFTIMTDNAIKRGVHPDVAVSKVSYMLNAYLGGSTMPEEISDDIIEYRNPNMEIAQAEDPDVDLPWDTVPRKKNVGGGNGGGNGNKKRRR